MRDIAAPILNTTTTFDRTMSMEPNFLPLSLLTFLTSRLKIPIQWFSHRNHNSADNTFPSQHNSPAQTSTQKNDYVGPDTLVTIVSHTQQEHISIANDHTWLGDSDAPGTLCATCQDVRLTA
ncbi:uncharacterized protein ACHE_70191S [Aspergillus chevalieri]|uniref:Uncharacterized protein n=1 Tax=Aspergillus chevalieri TaxID=182096 RepID=A0A7R7VV27_ASPCH|nr:uncharacterized protein ACHE_70191S [Aspergillus chevalieri]BCR91348.1 hypothetical protein ACHE_70191S [Aspergillus chevalieri]